MRWHKEDRKKQLDNYNTVNISFDEYDEMNTALNEYYKEREALRNSKIIKCISFVAIIILLISAYVFFSSPKIEKQTTLAENDEDAMPFYFHFMSTQQKADLGFGGNTDLQNRERDDVFIRLCETGTLRDINELIANRANVNAISSSGEHKGITPLRAALGNSDPRVITALVKAGADVNAKDSLGVSPLMDLAGRRFADKEMIIALINAGADVNAQDNLGMTPLILAARSSYIPEVITTLLDLGANPKIIDKAGKLAISHARQNRRLGNTEALRRLEEVSR